MKQYNKIIKRPIEDHIDDKDRVDTEEREERKDERKQKEEKPELHDIGKRTHVSDIVVLVIDEYDPRYGQIGRLWWDDSEYGTYGVKFKDGGSEEYSDGIERFYRGKDKEKEKGWEQYNRTIKDLKATFLELDVGSIERLKKDYKELFGEELP